VHVQLIMRPVIRSDRTAINMTINMTTITTCDGLGYDTHSLLSPVYDMMFCLSLGLGGIVFSRPGTTTSAPASHYPRRNPGLTSLYSLTRSCMFAMRTLCALDWACTTTPGGTATNSRRRRKRGRMMIDRFSRPTMFARGRGKCETR
jgi:hypothetical protein